MNSNLDLFSAVGVIHKGRLCKLEGSFDPVIKIHVKEIEFQCSSVH